MTQCRLHKGWTQHQLAAVVGTSQAVVQRIETGKCRHPRIIHELAAALDVTPAFLMYGVIVVEGLESEAIETARAWSKLAEPHRSALKEMIMRVVAESESRRFDPEGGQLRVPADPGERRLAAGRVLHSLVAT